MPRMTRSAEVNALNNRRAEQSTNHVPLWSEAHRYRATGERRRGVSCPPDGAWHVV